MSETSPAPRGQHVKSLSRSTLVMRVLADKPMRPADLSRELDKPWATIYRAVRVLTDEGMLQRDPDTGEYSVGPMMWAMATSYIRDHPVLGIGLGHLEQALPHVPGLLKVTERSGFNAVTLFAEQNPQAAAVTRIREQYRLPLHCASFGIVLLAHAPADFVEGYLARPLVAVSPRTITDPTALRKRLAEVREQGYAASRAELQDDNGSLSVPIRRKDGSVAAALTSVLPLPVLDDADGQAVQLKTLSETAGRISEALGWRGAYG
ncbi:MULTISPECIES: IclR family transcriptional regulator [unclassified Nocardioides]|uniref:IclR family transcriptional regulator n=1 Tax=unclassified Nocardioides TaxID=2615069 RepID=UPI0000571B79|nr:MULTISPECIES: IclR family transcriptional regulator [unclassified Nocardioides]ABL80212.1 regulatory protein, IclR [Nocardioides sp. JS614]